MMATTTTKTKTSALPCCRPRPQRRRVRRAARVWQSQPLWISFARIVEQMPFDPLAALWPCCSRTALEKPRRKPANVQRRTPAHARGLPRPPEWLHFMDVIELSPTIPSVVHSSPEASHQNSIGVLRVQMREWLAFDTYSTSAHTRLDEICSVECSWSAEIVC